MQIYNDYIIKNETTLKVGGCVEKVAFPETIDEFIELLKSEEYDLIMGNCSNVIYSSEKIHKKIILTKKLNKYEIQGNKVIVSCGTKGVIVAKDCQKRELTGFEFLIGFPGSFGGMLTMNSSAHQQCISEHFIKARVFDKRTKQVITLDKTGMNFVYRNSILSEGNYILLDAEFILENGNKEEIEERLKHNLEFRVTRQPSLRYGNAGSTFKNPENDSAGRLLDLCNMKGQSVGGARIFEKHANFILNYDNATSFDVISLMYKMHQAVFDKFGIALRPEIKYVGDKDTKEYKLWQLILTGNTTTIQK